MLSEDSEDYVSLCDFSILLKKRLSRQGLCHHTTNSSHPITFLLPSTYKNENFNIVNLSGILS